MFQKSAFDAPKKRIKNEDTEPTRKQLNHPFSIHLFTSKPFQKFIANFGQTNQIHPWNWKEKITTFSK